MRKFNRRKQVLALGVASAAAGIAVPMVASSAASAATGTVANYTFTTEPATGLSNGQQVTITVANGGNPSALATVEIHLCNTPAILDQFTYSFDGGVCTPTTLGELGNIDTLAGYQVPPGETSSVFTYKAVTGTSADNIVTCGAGSANCYLVYRVTNVNGDEFYYGQQLTFGGGVTTTTSTTRATTTTTVPTTSTTRATTTTTVPTTSTTRATTTTTGSTTTSTTQGTTTTTRATTSTTQGTTTTTGPTTSTTRATTTTRPTTSTTRATTTTTRPTTSTTRATTTTRHPRTTTTRPTTSTTRPRPGDNPLCELRDQLPRWLWQLIARLFGVDCR